MICQKIGEIQKMLRMDLFGLERVPKISDLRLRMDLHVVFCIKMLKGWFCQDGPKGPENPYEVFLNGDPAYLRMD